MRPDPERSKILRVTVEQDEVWLSPEYLQRQPPLDAEKSLRFPHQMKAAGQKSYRFFPLLRTAVDAQGGVRQISALQKILLTKHSDLVSPAQESLCLIMHVLGQPAAAGRAMNENPHTKGSATAV
jgi:hypothetical protein